MNAKLFRPIDAEKLDRLHPALRAVVYKCNELGTRFIVIETFRSKDKQFAAFRGGFTKALFGQSPHNYDPALAVDLGPANYPGKISDYKELALAMHLAARELKTDIVWGGEWKMRDYPHFELANWRRIKSK